MKRANPLEKIWSTDIYGNISRNYNFLISRFRFAGNNIGSALKVTIKARNRTN
jgi:hypothetical protein